MALSVNEEELGGELVIHTTEYNYANDDATIDNWVQFCSNGRHFNEIAE